MSLFRPSPPPVRVASVACSVGAGYDGDRAAMRRFRAPIPKASRNCSYFPRNGCAIRADGCRAEVIGAGERGGHVRVTAPCTRATGHAGYGLFTLIVVPSLSPSGSWLSMAL